VQLSAQFVQSCQVDCLAVKHEDRGVFGEHVVTRFLADMTDQLTFTFCLVLIVTID